VRLECALRIQTVVLDEPTVAMDVESRQPLGDDARSSRRAGKTVLSQQISEADDFGRRFVLMDGRQGRSPDGRRRSSRRCRHAHDPCDAEGRAGESESLQGSRMPSPGRVCPHRVRGSTRDPCAARTIRKRRDIEISGAGRRGVLE